MFIGLCSTDKRVTIIFSTNNKISSLINSASHVPTLQCHHIIRVITSSSFSHLDYLIAQCLPTLYISLCHILPPHYPSTSFSIRSTIMTSCSFTYILKKSFMAWKTNISRKSEWDLRFFCKSNMCVLFVYHFFVYFF